MDIRAGIRQAKSIGYIRLLRQFRSNSQGIRYILMLGREGMVGVSETRY